MSEGITANQLSEGIVTTFSRSVPITHAQIIAWPTTPIVVVPATETLGYEGFPTEFFVPHVLEIAIDTRAGAYAAQSESSFVLAVGSDWSDDLCRIPHTYVGNPLFAENICLLSVPIIADYITSEVEAVLAVVHSHAVRAMNVRLVNNLQDNALVVAFNNLEGGNFTGGNAANSGVLTVLYRKLSIPFV